MDIQIPVMNKSRIKKLCVAIPMYNEEKGASKCVEEVTKVLRTINVPALLIIVNDGSKDNTLGILKEAANKYENVHILNQEENKGYGKALVFATAEAERLGCDYILFMDSDLTNSPSAIPKFIEKIEEGYDLVKGSRYIKGGKVEGVPLSRYIISKIGNLIASRMFNLRIKDCTNGFRAVKIGLLTGLDFKENKFPIILEELYFLKTRGAKATEAPVTLYSRKKDQHPTAFQYTPEMFWNYLKYPIKGCFYDLKCLFFKIIGYFRLGPNNSRIIYDIFSAFFSVFVICSILSVFSMPIPSMLFIIGFPLLYLIINIVLGVYTRFGSASNLAKIILLFTSICLSSIFLFYLEENKLGIVLSAAFLFGPAILPRVFLNLPTKAKKDFWRPIVMKNCPVLVIGGAGYIGSWLVEKLLNSGKKVRILDKLFYGKEHIEDLLSNDNLELIEGDATDINKLTQAMNGVSAVVHMGGLVGDPACSYDEKFTRHTNIITTRMILETLTAFKVPKFIFASSCSVYGFNESVVNETSVLNPVSLYAKTKIDSEEEILANFKVPTSTILRFATVFGHSRRMRFDLAVNLFCAHAYYDKKISVFGQDQWRPFIHVADIADAIIRVLNADNGVVNREIFNVGDDRLNCTIGDVANKVEDYFKSIGSVINVEIKDVAIDERNYFVSFEKIRNKLGFVSSISLEEGVKQIAENMSSKTYKYDYKHHLYSNYETTKILAKDFYNPNNTSKTYVPMNEIDKGSYFYKDR